MKILSLFDGMSCGAIAFRQLGIPVDEYHAFEIDKFAVMVSKHNFPKIVHHGDVFSGDFTKFKNFDWLIGGLRVLTGALHRIIKSVKQLLPVLAGDSFSSMSGHCMKQNQNIFCMKIIRQCRLQSVKVFRKRLDLSRLK